MTFKGEWKIREAAHFLKIKSLIGLLRSVWEWSISMTEKLSIVISRAKTSSWQSEDSSRSVIWVSRRFSLRHCKRHAPVSVRLTICHLRLSNLSPTHSVQMSGPWAWCSTKWPLSDHPSMHRVCTCFQWRLLEATLLQFRLASRLVFANSSRTVCQLCLREGRQWMPCLRWRSFKTGLRPICQHPWSNRNSVTQSCTDRTFTKLPTMPKKATKQTKRLQKLLHSRENTQVKPK